MAEVSTNTIDANVIRDLLIDCLSARPEFRSVRPNESFFRDRLNVAATDEGRRTWTIAVLREPRAGVER